MTEPLLVIGAGNLGRRVAALWRERGGDVTAETRTEATHGALAALGAEPRRRADPAPAPKPYVLFAVPPSRTEDYAADAARAASLWSGEGRLVMISSTGVYVQSDGEVCPEDGPLADTARARRLLGAEARILDAGGTVLRHAGLYSEERGPHRVYLRDRTSKARPDGLVNLIHYDDAASLTVAALLRAEPGGVYMGCDDHPTTRQEIAQTSAASPRFRDLNAEGCAFTGTGGPRGRICDNTATRRALQWAPRWATFAAWLGGAP